MKNFFSFINNIFTKLVQFFKGSDIKFAFFVWFFITCLFFSKNIIKREPFSAADLIFDEYPWEAVAPDEFKYPSNELRIDDIYLNYPDLVDIKEQFDNGHLATYTDKKLSGENQYGFTYPFSPFFIPYFIFETNWGITISLMLRVYVCGVGMFFFLRRLNLSRIAAIFGGIAFCGSTSFFSWINTPISSTFALLPWTLLFANNLVTSKGLKMLKYVLLLGLALGISYIPGHLPSNIILNFIVGIYCLSSLIVNKSLKNFSFDTFKFYTKEVVLFVLSNIIALLYGLVSLYPFITKSLESPLIDRGNNGVKGIFSPLILLGYLIPNIFGNPAQRNWHYSGNFNEYITFAGVTTLLLVPFVLFKLKKHKQILVFIIIGIISFGLVFNIPVINLLNKFPGFKQTPNLRWAISLVFSLVIFSSVGLDYIINLTDKESKKISKVIDKIFPKVILFIIPICLLLFGFVLVIHSRINYYLEKARFSYLFPYIVFTSVIIIILVVSFYLIIYKKLKFLAVITIFTLLAELLLWINQFHPSEATKNIFPVTPGLQFLKDNQGSHRVLIINGDDFFISGNTNEAYGIRAVSGYDLFIDKDYQIFLYNACKIYKFDLQNYLMPSSTDCMFSELSDLLDIKYFAISPKFTNIENYLNSGDESVEIVHRGDDMIILENTDNYGGGWFAENTQRKENMEEDYKNINEYKLDPKIVTLVDDNTVINNCSSQVLYFVRVINKDTFEVQTNCDSLLVTNEKYDKSWKAYVNGEEREIMKANDIFLAIKLQTGDEKVELIYENKNYKLAFIVSLITGGLISFSIFVLIVIEKKEQTLRFRDK